MPLSNGLNHLPHLQKCLDEATSQDEIWPLPQDLCRCLIGNDLLKLAIQMGNATDALIVCQGLVESIYHNRVNRLGLSS